MRDQLEFFDLRRPGEDKWPRKSRQTLLDAFAYPPLVRIVGSCILSTFQNARYPMNMAYEGRSSRVLIAVVSHSHERNI